MVTRRRVTAVRMVKASHTLPSKYSMMFQLEIRDIAKEESKSVISGIRRQTELEDQ